MLHHRGILHDLADRARKGEQDAAHRLYHVVAPHVQRVVRRVVRARQARTGFEQCILAEADRAPMPSPSSGATATQEDLILHLTEHFCNRMYQRMMQTISPTQNFGPNDTVLHHA